MNAVMLSRASAKQALTQLAESRHPRALRTYVDLMHAMEESRDWGSVVISSPNGTLGLLRSLGLPEPVVPCPYRVRWVATYQLPENDQVEVTVLSVEKPPKRRSFRVPGGRRSMTRTTLATTTRRSTQMATKTRTRSRKPAPVVDEIEELEELEELDELEGEEEEAPKPARKRRSRKTKVEVEVEDEDEDEGDEDDDEDEDDEEPEEKPARKSRSKKPAAKPAAKSKRTPPTPPTRELPKGKVGVNDVAELAGVEGRDVRVWLRKNDYPKDEELNRYAFTAKQAQQVANKIKRAKAA